MDKRWIRFRSLNKSVKKIDSVREQCSQIEDIVRNVANTGISIRRLLQNFVKIRIKPVN